MERETDCNPETKNGIRLLNHIRVLHRFLADGTCTNDRRFCEKAMSNLNKCTAEPLNKEILQTSFKEILGTVRLCVARITDLDNGFHFYVEILSSLLSCCRYLVKTERFTKHLLPVICAAASIDDIKLTSFIANLIRLAIRYHPAIGSELALEPLLTAVKRNPSHELMTILFYIHSFNPAVFRLRGVGQQLLGIYSQTDVPIPIQIDCLLLLDRILDDLPRTDVATEMCFGSAPGDSIHILLKAGNKQLGAILPSVIVKFAQRDIYGSFAGYANHQLSNRLSLSWPGGLEAALTLLISLVQECFTLQHKHTKNTTCISGCIDAIMGYLKKSETVKQALACLVTLQDFNRFVSPGVIKTHTEVIESACVRFGIDPTMFWNYLNSYHTQKDNHSLRQMQKRTHAAPNNRLRVDQNLTYDSSGGEEAFSVDTPYRAHNGNSYVSKLHSTSPRSFSSSACGEKNAYNMYVPSIEEPYNDRPVKYQSYSKDQKQFYITASACEEPELVAYMSSDISTSTSATTAASYSPGEDQLSSSYLSFGEIEEGCMTKAVSVRFPTLPGISGQLNPPDSVEYPQTSRKQITPKREQLKKVPTNSGTSGSMFLSLTKSAPQLSPIIQSDAVQRFHERYFAKLIDYMDYISEQFPLPVALGLEDFRSTTEVANPRNLLWLNELATGFQESTEDTNSSRTTSRIVYPSLILYFACPFRWSQCLFRGTETNTCFRLVTDNPVTWMQLIILGTQVKYGKALPSAHPLMKNLRLFWSELVDPSTCFSRQRSILRVHSDSARYSSSRHRSSGISSVSSQEQGEETSPKSPLLNRIRTWNSMRVRSRKQLSKVNSFFFLATRGFPNTKECEPLLKELRNTRFFELFELMVNSREERQSLNPKKLDRWCCFLCNQTLQRRHSMRYKRGSSDCGTRPRKSGILEHLPLPVQSEPCFPELTAQLNVRHIKRVPMTLAWMSRWQEHEVILKDGILGWRRCDKRQLRRKQRPVDTGWAKTTSGSASHNGTLSQASGIANGRHIFVPSEAFNKNQWLCIPVATIQRIESVRNKKTGQLQQIQLTIQNHGVLFLKSILWHSVQLKEQSKVNCSEIPAVSTRPNKIDELTEWSRALQVAMIRAHRNFDS